MVYSSTRIGTPSGYRGTRSSPETVVRARRAVPRPNPASGRRIIASGRLRSLAATKGIARRY